ncbi:MAG: hypothetical protein KIT33_01830 [Candidatus Kapabacteria bacterium]|nr:hypothetical protein [Ignavibacteriota bacterium]MCW5883691.1 hypothetical protein [Candidatus Kapabacteria bacterium]
MLRIITTFLTISIFFFITSCSGSSQTPTAANPATDNVNSINSSRGEVLYQYTQARNHTYNNTTTISLTAIKEPHIGSAIAIVINGNTPGDYQLTDETYIRLIFGDQDFRSDNGSGILKITDYGQVKSKVKGTFSGTFSNDKTGEVITVTAGKFSADRLTDITK